MDTTARPPRMPQPFLKTHAVTLKLGWILLLVILLLIPLGMIRSVLRERLSRRDEAVQNITSSWGGEQVVVGPVLVIPYEYKTRTWRDQTVAGKVERVEVEKTEVANAFFLPDTLEVDGSVTPTRLHRGIYDAVVYEGSLEISGRFSRPDFGELGVSGNMVQWDKAVVTLAVSDLRGTGELLTMAMGGRDCDFAPGCRLNGFFSGITARAPGELASATNLNFRMTLALKGSSGISFAPVGRRNVVRLASGWPDPSFRGAFLPASRRVGEDGFEASWEVSWYGRNYPQQSTDRGGNQGISEDAIAPSLFGVDFIALVDSYRLVERATKYGALFIALIFAAFFLFETLAALRIHTVQYTLIGAALCLFYLALLSLSEFVRFGYAYWAGALASALLVVLYSARVLASGKRSAVIASALLVIYLFLFVVLQLQDYALLFGTAGLFLVLGIVMYSTRNLDWSQGD